MIFVANKLLRKVNKSLYGKKTTLMTRSFQFISLPRCSSFGEVQLYFREGAVKTRCLELLLYAAQRHKEANDVPV